MVVLSVGLNPPADHQGLSDTFGIELNSHGFCKTRSEIPWRPPGPASLSAAPCRGRSTSRSRCSAPAVPAPSAVNSSTTDGASWPRRGSIRRRGMSPGGAENRRLRLSLRGEHRQRGERSFRGRICPDAAQRGPRPGTALFLRHQLRQGNHRPGGGKRAQPRGHRGLLAQNPGGAVPRHAPGGGAQPVLLEMANIREQCSWVHSKEKEDATRKAKDIIRMSVARAAHLEPLQEFDLPVNKTDPGGRRRYRRHDLCALHRQPGPSRFTWWRRTSELGGMARRIHTTLEGMDVQAYLNDLIRSVYKNPLIHVSHEATIKERFRIRGEFHHHRRIRRPGEEDRTRRRRHRHRAPTSTSRPNTSTAKTTGC